jgi:hypothetical protein
VYINLNWLANYHSLCIEIGQDHLEWKVWILFEYAKKDRKKRKNKDKQMKEVVSVTGLNIQFFWDFVDCCLKKFRMIS